MCIRLGLPSARCRRVRASALELALVLGPGAVRGASAQCWPLHVREPAADAARITRDVTFASADSSALMMDVYRPTGATRSPALIFYTLFWPGDTPLRAHDWYRSWARLAAANGIVAIVPDLRAEPGTGNASAPARARGDDFQRLIAHLTAHAADYGIDPDRIAVYAASGAVWAALPAIQDPAQTAVKAAVIYYGSAEVQAFRPDLPLLWVRAGLDSDGLNSAIATATSRALSQNAPLTLVNHPTGHHAFEGRDDDALTRRIIEQTLEFVHRATSAEQQEALRRREAVPPG